MPMECEVTVTLWIQPLDSHYSPCVLLHPMSSILVDWMKNISFDYYFLFEWLPHTEIGKRWMLVPHPLPPKCSQFISGYPSHNSGSGKPESPLPLPYPHPWFHLWITTTSLDYYYILGLLIYLYIYELQLNPGWRHWRFLSIRWALVVSL